MSWQHKPTPASHTPKAAPGVLRLRMLAEHTEAAGEKMDALRPRFDKMRNQDKANPIVSDQLFPTPPSLAARMVEAAEVKPHHRILEPSAGTGRIVEQMDERQDVTAVEINKELCDNLWHRFADVRPMLMVYCQDFLKFDRGLRYDRIIMNPPFRRGLDIKHILHARTLLKKGGVIVSLCYDGVMQNKKLRPMCDSWEVLPEGSFKSEGTGAGVALLTMVADNG